MADALYLETTYISYLVARDTNDVVRQGQQEVSRQWWWERRLQFELSHHSSCLMNLRQAIQLLRQSVWIFWRTLNCWQSRPTWSRLRNVCCRQGLCPAKARLDALHIAVAAVNGVDYLLTWNCRHLANATLRPIIENTCIAAG